MVGPRNGGQEEETPDQKEKRRRDNVRWKSSAKAFNEKLLIEIWIVSPGNNRILYIMWSILTRAIMMKENEPQRRLRALQRNWKEYFGTPTVIVWEEGDKFTMMQGTKLGWSCLWNNAALDNYGFTPFQPVYGANPDKEEYQRRQA